MSTPHKYAEVIKAWADGRQVQFKYPHHEVWNDYTGGFEGTPDFCDTCDAGIEWRVKPEMLKYRRYIAGGPDNETMFIDTVIWSGDVARVEAGSTFVRWIDTEWQEVEI